MWEGSLVGTWRSRTGLAGPMRSRHEVNAGGKRVYLPLEYAADFNKIQ